MFHDGRNRPEWAVRVIGIFAAAKMTHLINDETVAKMGHPVVVVRFDVGTPPTDTLLE
jgi:hypothetical protein